LSEITVRHAILEDREQIAAYQSAMAKETEGLELDPERCLSGVTAVFENPGLGRYFVASDGERPAGCLLITPEWSDWRNGLVWWIQSVYVTAEYRRRGVYAALYRHVRSLAESDPNVHGIRLYVDRRNEVAQQVYRRLGMNGDHYQLFEWMKE
jgi:GNAT superfamily N-acetyltransferase